MTRLRRASILAGLLAACSSGVGSPEAIEAGPGSVVAEVPSRAPEPAPAARDEPEPPRRSCLARAAASQVPLASPGFPVEIGERTFVRAWRRKGADTETVIASLDARGALEVTAVPVPASDPQVLGADAGGLTLVSVPPRGKGALVRVELTASGGLRPREPVALPEVEWGWPIQLASDGSRALLLHAQATPEQSIGGAMLYTIDLAAGKVIASEALATGTNMSCGAGGCVLVDVAREPARLRVTRRAWGGGAEVREVALTSGCLTAYGLGGEVVVAPGAPWRAVWLAGAAPFVRDAATDPSLAPLSGCPGALTEFPATRRPGLLEGVEGRRTLLRWDRARRVFGAREPLPDLGFRESALLPFADGVLEVAWTGGHSMVHTPTDSRGMRRYYQRWYFEGGEVRLLRRESDRWIAVDPAPLVVAKVEGDFHRGYSPLVVRNGLHAAALILPEGGEAAWLQPYLAPCP